MTSTSSRPRVRIDPATIASRTPEWVGARLWEMTLTQEPIPCGALRQWVNLWALLGYLSLIPSSVWSGSDSDAFNEAVVRTVAAEPALGTGLQGKIAALGRRRWRASIGR